MTERLEKCKDCNYSQMVKNKPGQLECHGNTPELWVRVEHKKIPTPIVGQFAMAEQVNISGIFPPVSPDNWCGRFKPSNTISVEKAS